jgi:hypothetical protein
MSGLLIFYLGFLSGGCLGLLLAAILAANPRENWRGKENTSAAPEQTATHCALHKPR